MEVGVFINVMGKFQGRFLPCNAGEEARSAGGGSAPIPSFPRRDRQGKGLFGLEESRT